MTITIKKTITPATGYTLPSFYKACQKHKYDVSKIMDRFIDMLREAKHTHDNDKFTGNHSMFELVSKGKAVEWFVGHTARTRHHLNVNVPDDVNLIDVLEMIADSVAINKSKGLNEPVVITNELLQKAFQNTVDKINKAIVVKG